MHVVPLCCVGHTCRDLVRVALRERAQTTDCMWILASCGSHTSLPAESWLINRQLRTGRNPGIMELLEVDGPPRVAPTSNSFAQDPQTGHGRIATLRVSGSHHPLDWEETTCHPEAYVDPTQPYYV
jgi:hypothetical protein